MTPQDRLIVALDDPDRGALERLMDQLEGEIRWIKLGLVAFAAHGPEIVREARSRGFSVFLDLKLHDIPHQVGLATAAVAELDVQLLTIHAAGGAPMMRSAAEAASDSGLALLAVTVLTSMDRATLEAVGIDKAPAELVIQRARAARDSGVHGVVASALEACELVSELGPSMRIVTPGIRPAGSATGDQRRVATPAAAIAGGATQLVVGRPITMAADPAAAARALLDEIAGAEREEG